MFIFKILDKDYAPLFCEFEHNVGEVACFRLRLPGRTGAIAPLTEGYLSFQGNALLRGFLIQEHQKDEGWEGVFRCGPETLDLSEFVPEGLLVKKGSLEGRTHLPFVDALTHALSLKNIGSVKGKTAIQHILYGSVRRRALKPLEALSVEIKAQWNEEGEGTINLFPFLEKAFPGGRVSSFAPPAFESQWPKVGDRVGAMVHRAQSGYWVEKSWLKPCGQGLDGQTFYEGMLSVYGRYTQRRRGVLVLSHGQGTGPTVRFDLGFLGSLSCDSFFRSEKGFSVMQEAVSIFQTYWTIGRRQEIIEFTVPFIEGLELRLHEGVQWEEGGLKHQGQIIGLKGRLESSCQVITVQVVVFEGMFGAFELPELPSRLEENPIGLEEIKVSVGNVLNPRPTQMALRLKDLRDRGVREERMEIGMIYSGFD